MIKYGPILTNTYSLFHYDIFQFYQYAEKQSEAVKEKGQSISSNLFFMKQFVSNACGTIALVHSIANNVERYINVSC